MGLYTTACIRILQILTDNGMKNKSLCMIGRQNINVEWNSFMRIINRMGIAYDQKICEEIHDESIDSYMFFKMFGIKDVHAIDLNPEDGADIILDLNDDLPANMIGKYDYVLNGGTLEHIFDVAKAMVNISELTKPGGGIIIHLVPLVGYVDHGFYSFSPSFFIDYYCANHFNIKSINMDFRLDQYGRSIYSQDCRLFDDWLKSHGSMNEYIKKIYALPDVGTGLLWCVAQRKEKTTVTYPLQGMYATIYEEQKRKNENAGKMIHMEKVINFLKMNFTKDISFFCAGGICRRVIGELYKEDMEQCVLRIFDNDILKAGEVYCGYKIVYPTKKKLDETDLILICSDKYDDEILNALLEKGIKKEKLYKVTAIS